MARGREGGSWFDPNLAREMTEDKETAAPAIESSVVERDEVVKAFRDVMKALEPLPRGLGRRVLEAAQILFADN